MHTESTLKYFDNSLTRLGKDLRHFKKTTCTVYVTRDLPSEVAAHGRRTAALAATNAQSMGTSKRKSLHGHPTRAPIKKNNWNFEIKADAAKDSDKTPPPKQRELNLDTSKIHALGHYVNSIQRQGMTDNYSTQIGELAHQQVKQMFPVVHKSTFTLGIAKYEQWQQILNRMHTHASKSSKLQRLKLGKSGKSPEVPWLQFENDKKLPPGSPHDHHAMSHEVQHGLVLSDWLKENEEDPVLKDFLIKLKDHCLA
ncbi:hypothetical protein C0995_001923 [Termitomyces sp. Mi166|nr:hypothetical protein C0995_001923 [Termitomyces sp. Mi166\